MTNSKPSLPQCLVLHDIADDGVWLDIVSGRWHSTHIRNDVTLQVDILHRDGYITIVNDVIGVSASGWAALERRPLFELLERLNGPLKR